MTLMLSYVYEMPDRRRSERRYGVDCSPSTDSLNPAMNPLSCSSRDRGCTLLLRCDPRAQARFLFLQLRRELGTEVLGFENLSNLDLGFLHPLDWGSA